MPTITMPNGKDVSIDDTQWNSLTPSNQMQAAQMLADAHPASQPSPPPQAGQSGGDEPLDGTLNIDGVGTFKVNKAAFAKLSPQDQHAAVDEIVASVRGNRSSPSTTPPAASHSLAGAALNSLENGLPEAVHSGEAAAANYLKGSTVGNFLDSLGGTSMAQSGPPPRPPQPTRMPQTAPGPTQGRHRSLAASRTP